MRKKVKHKTRKLIFTAASAALAAILASLLLTCIPGPPDDNEDFVLPEFTDVDYSPDGSSVTIYLDGSAPVRSSRALSLENAKLGHDLFEVAFQYGSTVARAVWEMGHAAGVSGVARGVDYASAFSYGAGLTGNNGAAILFVGKKSDRTLLAVGRLTHVNNGEGNEEDTFITADTKSVTFSVAALRAGVHESINYSSFLTDAKVASRNPVTENTFTNIDREATDIIPVKLGILDFPLFRMDENLRDGQYVHASYRFSVVVDNFDDDYKNGIIQKGNIEFVRPTVPDVAYDRIPRYPIGDNDWQTSENNAIQTIDVDQYTTMSIHSNSTFGTPFTNPVLFGFYTIADQDGTAFAFSFEIPVYPLTSAGGRDTGFSWYLRPGYDSFNMDLDDGKGGTGGAILMGTGRFEVSISTSLYMRRKPAKTRYNPVVGYNFSLADMELYLRLGNTMTPITPIPNPTTGLLYFFIGTTMITNGQPIQPLLQAHNDNGAVIVSIEYYTSLGTGTGTNPYNPDGTRNEDYNGGPPYPGEFTIFYFAPAGDIDFTVPPGNRYVIVNSEDFNRFQNEVVNEQPGGTFIVVFFSNFDLGPLVLQNNQYFIIMLAGKPDIIIGKSGANVFTDQNTNNLYYFGAWPFDEILAIDGMAVNSEPFIINAGGSWRDVDPENMTASSNDGQYFITGAGAKTVNDMGVRVIGRANFYQ